MTHNEEKEKAMVPCSEMYLHAQLGKVSRLFRQEAMFLFPRYQCNTQELATRPAVTQF